jgi:uncharacterized protein
MPRDNPALARISRAARQIKPPSDAFWRWLPVGIGVGLVVLIALIYALGVGRSMDRITIVTGTEGGTYDALGQVIAQSFSDANTAIRTGVQRSIGAAENAQRVAANKTTLGFVQSNTQLERNVKLIARLYPEVYHLLARTDAGIAHVSDLAGKRVALMPEGSGSNTAFFQLLDHYQISSAAVNVLPGTLSEGLAALTAGEVDALFLIIALGNEAVADAIRNAEIELLGLDQAQAMALFDPAISRMEVPKGVYSGDRPVPRETIDVLSVDALLVANAGLPDEIANQIVTTLFERRQQMVEANSQAAFISAPNDQQRLTIGVHPGAESYYQRDRPPFLVEYAEPIGLAVSVLVLLASGLWQARLWLSNARKNRADRYNLEIAALVDQADQASTLAELEELRASLFAIFHEVIADLDNDRIDENSLQSFSFVWEVAQSTLSQRQLVLAGQGGRAASQPRTRKKSS